ncbi:MAG: hypothetical protein IKY06_03530, partial [Clostridia bacterium]|nr:hypothetical protein [Clostridia bacterium]
MAQTVIPQAFWDSVRPLLGDELGAFREALLCAPPQALRLNPLKPCPDAAAFTGGNVPWEDTGRYIKEGARPGLSLLQAAGAY